MTEEILQAICEILQDEFGFDDFDVVEFVMEYEKKTGEKIPDHWIHLSMGRMKTVNLK